MGSDFRDELAALINKHSQENGSDTPDFILAAYLDDCLRAFNSAVTARTIWYKPADDPAPESPRVPEGEQGHEATLKRFSEFERGWDSYNGAPINARVIELARLLSPLLSDWHLAPCSDGTIQFEKSANGSDDEIEISSTPAGVLTQQPAPRVCTLCGRTLLLEQASPCAECLAGGERVCVHCNLIDCSCSDFDVSPDMGAQG